MANSVRHPVPEGRHDDNGVSNPTWEESGDVNVSVEVTLSPPSAPHQGFWVGKENKSDGARLAGWASLAPRLNCRRETAIELAATPGRVENLLFLPAAWAIAATLAPLRSMRCATVLGDGPLAAIAEDWLRQHSVSTVPVGTARGADVVIDTSGEPARWEQALPTVCDEGTVVLMVPPWASAFDFNFYQVIHRRSLQLIASRWNRIPRQPSSAEIAALAPLAARAMADGRYVRDATAAPSGPTEQRWSLSRQG
jgi:hypothetical protein